MDNRGLIQSDLVKLTGEPVMTISRVCRGQNVPRATLAAKLAEALDVSIDRLLAQPPEFAEKQA